MRGEPALRPGTCLLGFALPRDEGVGMKKVYLAGLVMASVSAAGFAGDAAEPIHPTFAFAGDAATR